MLIGTILIASREAQNVNGSLTVLFLQDVEIQSPAILHGLTGNALKQDVAVGQLIDFQRTQTLGLRHLHAAIIKASLRCCLNSKMASISAFGLSVSVTAL